MLTIMIITIIIVIIIPAVDILLKLKTFTPALTVTIFYFRILNMSDQISTI